MKNTVLTKWYIYVQQKVEFYLEKRSARAAQTSFLMQFCSYAFVAR